MASHLFLISYILDDQPMTCELHSEADTLSREEARRHLRHCIDRTTPRRSAISRSARWSVPMNRAPRRDTTSSPDGGREKEGGGAQPVPVWSSASNSPKRLISSRRLRMKALRSLKLLLFRKSLLGTM